MLLPMTSYDHLAVHSQHALQRASVPLELQKELPPNAVGGPGPDELQLLNLRNLQ